jgi:rhamnose transport system permease protein
MPGTASGSEPLENLGLNFGTASADTQRAPDDHQGGQSPENFVARLKTTLTGRETTLFLAVVVVSVVATITIQGFSSTANISQVLAGSSEIALMVLPLTLIIIAREIDISVASIAGVASCSLGLFVEHGMALGPAIALVLIIGAAAGALNGFLVAYVGLPSLIVTLSTLNLYRGICWILLGPNSISTFPNAFQSFGYNNVGTSFPLDLVPDLIVPFLVLLPIFWFVLRRTSLGRRIYVIGGNPDAALYSGIRVQRHKFFLFVVSGIVSALAGIVYTAHYATASGDNAYGLELNVVTVAFLGGLSVYGGKGSMSGVLWSLVLIAVVQDVLGLKDVSGDLQAGIIGLMLIVAVLTNNLTASLGARRRSRRRELTVPPP